MATSADAQFHDAPAVIAWLRDNYKLGKQGHMEKAGVYQHYNDACAERNCRSVMSPTYFGKLVKRAFPGIKDVRKGPRGAVKQCYALLKKRNLAKEEKLRLAERLHTLIPEHARPASLPYALHSPQQQQQQQQHPNGYPEWAPAMKTEDEAIYHHHHLMHPLQHSPLPHESPLHHHHHHNQQQQQHQWRRSPEAWAPAIPALPPAAPTGGRAPAGDGERSKTAANKRRKTRNRTTTRSTSPHSAGRGQSDSGEDGSDDPEQHHSEERVEEGDEEEEMFSSPGSMGWSSSSSPSSTVSGTGSSDAPPHHLRRHLTPAGATGGGLSGMSISLSMSMPVMGGWSAHLPPPAAPLPSHPLHHHPYPAHLGPAGPYPHHPALHPYAPYAAVSQGISPPGTTTAAIHSPGPQQHHHQPHPQQYRQQTSPRQSSPLRNSSSPYPPHATAATSSSSSSSSPPCPGVPSGSSPLDVHRVSEPATVFAANAMQSAFTAGGGGGGGANIPASSPSINYLLDLLDREPHNK